MPEFDEDGLTVTNEDRELDNPDTDWDEAGSPLRQGQDEFGSHLDSERTVLSAESKEFTELVDNVLSRLATPEEFDSMSKEQHSELETKAIRLVREGIEKQIQSFEKNLSQEPDIDLAGIYIGKDGYVEVPLGEVADFVEGVSSIVLAKLQPKSESNTPKLIESGQQASVTAPEAQDLTLEAQADKRFQESFATASNDRRFAQSVRDISRNEAQKLTNTVGRYWETEQGTGDRGSVINGLLSVFDKVAAKIREHIPHGKIGELARELDPVPERTPKLEHAIEKIIKLNLTDAEVELGLRREYIKGQPRPDTHEPKDYKDHDYQRSVFKIAASGVFTRVASALESLGLRVYPEIKKSESVSTAASRPESRVEEVVKSEIGVVVPEHVDNISGAYLEVNGVTPKPAKTAPNFSTKVDPGFDVGAFLEEPVAESVSLAQTPQEIVNRDWAKEKLIEFAVHRLGAVGVKDRALVPQVVIALWDYNEDGVTDALEAKAIVEEGLKFLAQKKGLEDVSKLDLDQAIFDEMRTLIDNSINYGSFEPKSNMDSETRERGAYFKKLQAEVIAREDEEYLEVLRDHYDNIYGPETSSDKKAA